MKRAFVLVIALCTFTAAMVPRDRRAVNTEEEETLRTHTTTTTTEQDLPIICGPKTPCAWSVYQLPQKFISLNVTNSYCICDASTVCRQYEDDTSTGVFVHRCRPPLETEESTTEDS